MRTPRVRAESKDDSVDINHLLKSAFPTDVEARLVHAIRESGDPFISLVAEIAEIVVGHIFFTEAHVIDGDTRHLVAALAPMAVIPERQRQAIGSVLVREGLDVCRKRGYPGVVVLGHAEYYPRFGFRMASAFGIRCPYNAPDEAWMAIELEQGGLERVVGFAKFHDAFDAL